jgi:hypothetical protein
MWVYVCVVVGEGGGEHDWVSERIERNGCVKNERVSQ